MYNILHEQAMHNPEASQWYNMIFTSCYMQCQPWWSTERWCVRICMLSSKKRVSASYITRLYCCDSTEYPQKCSNRTTATSKFNDCLQNILQISYTFRGVPVTASYIACIRFNFQHLWFQFPVTRACTLNPHGRYVANVPIIKKLALYSTGRGRLFTRALRFKIGIEGSNRLFSSMWKKAAWGLLQLCCQLFQTKRIMTQTLQKSHQPQHLQ